MLLYQRDEVGRSVSGERGLAEMRVRRQKVLRLAMQIGEIAAATAGDEDLFPEAIGALHHRNAAASLPCLDSAHQAGSAATQYNRIEASSAHGIESSEFCLVGHAMLNANGSEGGLSGWGTGTKRRRQD